MKVWDALKKIPYGETRSYKELAKMAGSPKAFRAAGNANNKNRLPILVPCHRVLGASGKPVGFGSGLWRQELLLKVESRF
ncbi:MAG: methylated-DNA--[protein]-cysteine S-methyltransferase [Fibrobacterota bacterium]